MPDEVVTTAAAGPEMIDVVVRGDVPEAAVAHARGKVARLARLLDEPVLHVRLKLSLLADPAVDRPAVAQVNVDLNGELVRAHVRAHTFGEAADLLEQRLRDRLEHRSEHRQARDLGLPPEPGTWRHRGLSAGPRSYFSRPVEDREVVCHKTFATGELTPDEAAFDLEDLDYDFYLFADVASGEDSLLWKDDGDRYHLSRLHPSLLEAPATAVPLTVDAVPAPVLAVADALERLNASDEPFVFFEDASTGRGDVLYRRYDGHYGLITPATG